MNRSLHFPAAHHAAPRTRLTQLARAALFTGLTVAAMTAARADTLLTFGTHTSGELTVERAFTFDGLSVAGYSFDPDAQPTDVVGAIVDGTDSVAACGALQCPASDGSYLTGLNDGIIEITSNTPGQLLGLNSFDASFLGSSSFSYPDTAGLLVVRGYTLGGGYDQVTYALGAPGVNGFEFGLYDTAASFGVAKYLGFDFFAAACDGNGDCYAGSTGQGQFAIDNISLGTSAVTPVPEPQTWLMLGAGLLAVGTAARRRRAAA